MKYSLSTTVLAASPVEKSLSKRQFGSTTQNELELGSCRDIIFLFARGSTEQGNFVRPPTLTLLACPSFNQEKKKPQPGRNPQPFTNQSCTPTGRQRGPPNLQRPQARIRQHARRLPGRRRRLPRLPQHQRPPARGTTPQAIDEAIGLFELADSKCPDSIIVAGGYSQGAAVMNGAVEDLDPSVQEEVAGVVLYGSTRNLHTGSNIPNFPEEKSLAICAATDAVCSGTLLVTAGHLSYGDDVPEAVECLAERIEVAGAGAGSASATAAEIEGIAAEEGGAFGDLTPGTTLGGDDERVVLERGR